MRRFNRKVIRAFNIFGIAVLLNTAFLGWMGATGATSGPEVAYALPAGSIVYDGNNGRIELMAQATVRESGNEGYKLTYAGASEEFALGDHPVAYETDSSTLNLFGDGYRVYRDGSVEAIKARTEITDYENSAFYKLADRRYVITGGTISDETGLFTAQGFLFIVMDRLGDARLLNDRVDMTTLEPMTLVCGDVRFEISSEKLLLGSGNIDLTRILGSSTVGMDALRNMTEEETPAAGDSAAEGRELITIRGGSGGTGGTGGSGGIGGTGGIGGIGGIGGTGGFGGSGGIGGSGGTGGNGGNGGNGGSGGDGVAGTGDNVAGGTFDNANITLRRSIAFLGASSDVTSITVHYAVVDPGYAYGSVFLLVNELVGNGEVKRMELDTAFNSATVYGLNPGSAYTASIGYHSFDAASEEIVDIVRVSTPPIAAYIQPTVLTPDSLTFVLKLDSLYTPTAGNISLYQGQAAIGAPYATEHLSPEQIRRAASGGLELTFDYGGGAYITLCLEDVHYQGSDVDMSFADVTIKNTTSSQLQPLSMKIFDAPIELPEEIVTPEIPTLPEQPSLPEEISSPSAIRMPAQGEANTASMRIESTPGFKLYEI
jgi:hypothetical protein